MRFKEYLTARNIVLAFLALIFIAFAYLWLFRVSIIERHLSKELNLTVRIKEAAFSYNRLIIKNLSIKNPRQTVIPNILEIQNIEVTVNPLRLFLKKKTLEKVVILTPQIFVEFYNTVGSESNWANILNSMTYTNSSLYTIQNLSILETYFHLYNFEGQEISVWPVPYTDMSELNVEKGLPLTAIFKLTFLEIFSKMISKAELQPFSHSIKPVPSEIYSPAG